MLEWGGTDDDTIAGLEQVCSTVDLVFCQVKTEKGDLCLAIGSFGNRSREEEICMGI